MDTRTQHPHAADPLEADVDPRSKLPDWFTARPGWDTRRHVFGSTADVGDKHNWIATVLADLDWEVEWHDWRDGSGRRWANCTPPNFTHVHTPSCVGICSVPAKYVTGCVGKFPPISDGAGRDASPYADGTHTPTARPQDLAATAAKAARIEGDNA